MHLETEDLRERIIKYWDKAGLCSFESSTSKNDPNIASCYNYIETHLLYNILTEYENCIALDVGAGLGRFTVVLAKRCRCVHAIEPAKRLFKKLSDNCGNLKNVKVFNTDLESFEFEAKVNYDFVILSGILYLYPDSMVINSLKIVARKLNLNGTILIRDFIVNNGRQIVPSKYVDGGQCYYRDSSYWVDVAKTLGLNQVNIFQCSKYLIPKFMPILTKLNLTRIFKNELVMDFLYKCLESKRRQNALYFGNQDQEIKTVFMVMKKI